MFQFLPGLRFLDYRKVKKNNKKYAHHYNRCKIQRGIQIRAQNWVPRKRKAGKCKKLSKNHKIACKKIRCGKISGAPITILTRFKQVKTFGAW